MCIRDRVLVAHGLHRHHAEPVAHAVPGDHGPGKLGGLLDIVGRAGGDGVENQLLRSPPAGEGCDLVERLILAHQDALALSILHALS